MIRFLISDSSEVWEAIAGADIFINATGLRDQSLWPSDAQLKAGAMAFDLNYRPAKSKFLEEAESLGAEAHNGTDFFLTTNVLQASAYLWLMRRRIVDYRELLSIARAFAVREGITDLPSSTKPASSPAPKTITQPTDRSNPSRKDIEEFALTLR
jgi:hypothetical protein